MLASGFRSSGNLSFIPQFSKEWHQLASTASVRNRANISKKLDFWWSIPQKAPALGILVPGMIQPSQSVMFLMKWGCKVIEAMEVVEAVEVIEAAEVLRSGKSLLRTLESSRFLNSALFWCFEKILTWKIHEISYWNLPPFWSEAVEASWCYFFENWWMKLKCPLLLKPLATIENSQSFYPSEPFRIMHFTMRHPVPKCRQSQEHRRRRSSWILRQQ